jgi:hypothetical protein
LGVIHNAKKLNFNLVNSLFCLLNYVSFYTLKPWLISI